MHSRIDESSWVLTRPIAHRGLVGDGFFENTYPAYERAIENGYPIEMDVQVTRDGVPVCVHDDNLKRLTGKDVYINDITAEEAGRLTIGTSGEHIPLFRDFLKCIDGRTPLMIEIKMPRNFEYDIAGIVVNKLRSYRGEFVVQSFDPRIMLRVRKYAPEMVRGLLAGAERSDNLSLLQYVVVKHRLGKFTSKPDYINYKLECMPIYIQKPHIVWTVKSEEDRKKAESFGCNYVFENIRP